MDVGNELGKRFGGPIELVFRRRDRGGHGLAFGPLKKVARSPAPELAAITEAQRLEGVIGGSSEPASNVRIFCVHMLTWSQDRVDAFEPADRSLEVMEGRTRALARNPFHEDAPRRPKRGIDSSQQHFDLRHMTHLFRFTRLFDTQAFSVEVAMANFGCTFHAVLPFDRPRVHLLRSAG